MISNFLRSTRKAIMQINRYIESNNIINSTFAELKSTNNNIKEIKDIQKQCYTKKQPFTKKSFIYQNDHKKLHEK